MRRAAVLVALTTIGLSLNGVASQGPSPRVAQSRVAQIQQVKDNLYLITGGGANTAAFVTDDGVILVDTKSTGWGQALMDQLRTVTDKPVIQVINTHAHLENVGVNPFFGTFVEFVAHDNTKANMAKLELGLRPPQVFKDRLTLGKGKDQIDLYYFGRGHTDGDAWVVFKSLRVLHAGDMVPGKTTPIIDVANGGSALQFATTVSAAASTLTDIDTVITGHGALLNAADFKEYVGFVNEFADWVEAQMKAGYTVDQASTRYSIPPKYQGYMVNSELGGVKSTIQAAYDELRR